MPYEPQVHYRKARAPHAPEHVFGVPARNLPLSEWERLPEDVRAHALATGLYTLPEPKPDAKTDAKAGSPERTPDK